MSPGPEAAGERHRTSRYTDSPSGPSISTANRIGPVIHGEVPRCCASCHTQRPTNASNARKCAQAMVAPRSVPSSSAICGNSGRITAGRMVAMSGSTSAT